MSTTPVEDVEAVLDALKKNLDLLALQEIRRTLDDIRTSALPSTSHDMHSAIRQWSGERLLHACVFSR